MELTVMFDVWCDELSGVVRRTICVYVCECVWVGGCVCMCVRWHGSRLGFLGSSDTLQTHTPTQETIKKTPCLHRCSIRPSPLAPSLALDASVRQRRLKLWGGGETVAPRNAAHEHGTPTATLHYYVRRDSKWWPRALSPPRAATQMSKWIAKRAPDARACRDGILMKLILYIMCGGAVVLGGKKVRVASTTESA